MIALLIKASLVIIVLLAFYKLILEKESFFAVNRIYLLTCLVLTFTLPFFTLPQLINNQGFVSSFLEQSNIQEIPQQSDEVFLPKENAITHLETPPINKEISKNEIIQNAPTKEDQTNLIAKEEAMKTQTTTPPIKASTTKGISFWILAIYLFGVVILAFNLIAQVINTLLKVFKNDDKVVDDEGTIINMSTKMEPCSFFKYIFINPTEYDYETYEQILAHEKIHVAKWHTLDLLIAELAVIALWFNPFIWKYRQEVEKNIEYQTDDLLVRGEVEEKEIYQMNLLKIATYTQPLSITTNYNQSLIKNRIIKMNTKKSNPHSFWKYAFIAPTIFGLLLILNKPFTAHAITENIVENVLENKSDLENTKEDLSKNEKQKNQVSSLNNNSNPVIDESNSKPSTNTSAKKNTPTIKFSNKEDCMALENAAKAKDLKMVKNLLMNYSPDCLAMQTQDQKDNMALIKQMVNRGAEIYIEDGSGNITIKGNTTRIWSDDQHKAYRQAHNSENIFNPIDNEELDAAINESNELAAANILKNLDPKYLVNQDERSFKHLKYMKYILNNGGKLSIDYSIVYINHDDKFYSSNGHEYNDDNQYEGSTTECKALINAVRNNDISKVKELLKSTDPNCIDHKPEYETTTEDGFTWKRTHAKTPLIAAARKGYFEIGKLLIDAGARVNHQAKEGETPLIAAGASGYFEFVKYLVNQGADINILSNGYGSALNAAAGEGHAEVVKYLISQGANINAETNGQGSALTQAAGNGELEVVKYLLSNDANINASTNGQGSALTQAAGNGELEVVKYLLSKNANIDAATNGQGSALTQAAGNGELEIIKYLLSKNANIDAATNGQGSALTKAAGNGEIEIVKYLLTQGADINAATNGQGSALTKAAGNGEIEMVKFLLSKGADINAATNGQGSALTKAAGNGEIEMAKFLLSKGADINAATNGQGSALMKAVQNEEYAMAKFLLENGANPSFSLSGQNSAMDKARKNNDRKMYDLLKKYDKW